MSGLKLDTIVKHVFAREYGWTAKEVDETHAIEVDRMLNLIMLDKEHEEEELKKLRSASG